MASENKAWTEVPQLQPRKGNDAPQCGPLNQGQRGQGWVMEMEVRGVYELTEKLWFRVQEGVKGV